jgi:hypothetical protein
VKGHEKLLERLFTLDVAYMVEMYLWDRKKRLIRIEAWLKMSI